MATALAPSVAEYTEVDAVAWLESRLPAPDDNWWDLSVQEDWDPDSEYGLFSLLRPVGDRGPGMNWDPDKTRVRWCTDNFRLITDPTTFTLPPGVRP